MKFQIICLNRKSHLVFLIFLFLAQLSRSQANNNFIHLDKVFRTFSLLERDSDGAMWVSDLDGIYKYNGYEFIFTSYSHIFGDNFVNKRPVLVQGDANHTIWIATRSGHMAHIDTVGNINEFKTGHLTKVITAIASGAKQTWLGSSDGTIYSVSKDYSEMIPILKIPLFRGENQGVNKIIFDKNTIWIATDKEIIAGFKSQMQLFD